MAAHRAHESTLEHPLFDDPYAQILACEHLGVEITSANPAQRCRTRFFEDIIEWKYQQGVRQFVFLGAGMDTRAFRMEGIGHAVFFEVDKDQVFAIKEPILQREPLKCAGRSVIALDLSKEKDIQRLGQELAAKRFDASQVSVWILEGFIMYLNPDSANQLFRKISELACLDSAVLFDCSVNDLTNWRIDVSGAPWLSSLDSYYDVLRQNGLSILDVISYERFLVEKDSDEKRKLFIRMPNCMRVKYKRKSEILRDDEQFHFGLKGSSKRVAGISGYIVILNRAMTAAEIYDLYAAAERKPSKRKMKEAARR